MECNSSSYPTIDSTLVPSSSTAVHTSITPTLTQSFSSNKNELYIALNHPSRTWKSNLKENFKRLSPVLLDQATSVTCENDIRCAAFALTSLSLSPAACKTFPVNGFKEGNKISDSEGDDSISENGDKSDEFPFFSLQPSSARCDPLASIEDIEVQASLQHVNNANYFRYDEKKTENKPKPRSYSHQDVLNNQSDFSKPRSSSFDAVGRACKYYPTVFNNESRKSVGWFTNNATKMLCRRLGSSPVDEGLGSSSGSMESLDQNASKRKMSSGRLFRCMWRGCDKETSSLNGIIMHVRHAHIGPSNAGEEEFYFDDVNINSNTTSGISSSEESLHDERGKINKLSSPVCLDTESYQQQKKEIVTPPIIKHTTLNKIDGGNVAALKHSNERDTHRVSFDIPTLATSSHVTPKKIRSENNVPPFTPEPYSPCSSTLSNVFVPTEGEKCTRDVNMDINNITQAMNVDDDLLKNVQSESATVKFDVNKQNPFANPLNEMSFQFTSNRHVNDYQSEFSQTEHQHTCHPHVYTSNVSPVSIPTDAHKLISKRKGRKKCRKVYGMTNKHLWCTQCRWKKACIRFK